MILLVDNYDSFVYNLARYFQRLGQETCVVRNDQIEVAAIRRLKPEAIVISPGPCTPAEAGCSMEVVQRLWKEFPILGVCLGHQAIAAALGGRIQRARQPRHGRTSVVEHLGTPLFEKIPSPFTACRYHSLVVEQDSLGDDLRVSAISDEGTVMAIEHTEYPVYGVQFHPESVLTEHGYQLLANFLSLSGLTVKQDASKLQAVECRTKQREPSRIPQQQPVTF